MEYTIVYQMVQAYAINTAFYILDIFGCSHTLIQLHSFTLSIFMQVSFSILS